MGPRSPKERARSRRNRNPDKAETQGPQDKRENNKAETDLEREGDGGGLPRRTFSLLSPAPRASPRARLAARSAAPTRPSRARKKKHPCRVLNHQHQRSERDLPR
eukprot:8467819-Pyramimonas_sp.AAC.1